MLHTKPWATGPFLPEKMILKRFVPYIGVAAILIKWPRCGGQTFILSTHWGSIWNLALIGQVVSEEKTSEEFSLYESM